MKKKSIILFAALLATFSCSKVEGPSEQAGSVSEKDGAGKVAMTFTSDALISRAYLDTDGYSVKFEDGDRVAIFAEGDSEPDEFTVSIDGSVATITGETTPGASAYYALYPYKADARLVGGTITNVDFSKKTLGGQVGTFNKERGLAVAKTTGSTMVFKNVCALLKVTVPASTTGLKQINIFNRLRNEDVAEQKKEVFNGILDITPDNSGSPSVTVTNDPDNTNFEIAINGAGGGTFAAGTYYIPVLPCRMRSGFDIKMEFSGNIVNRAYNGSNVTLQSGKIYNLGTIRGIDTGDSSKEAFLYHSFEANSISDTEFTSDIANGGPELIPAENPGQDLINGSTYVLKLQGDDKTRSGYFNINFPAAKFPSGKRSSWKVLQIKIYLGNNKYCPYLYYNKSSNNIKPAARVNGNSFADNNSNGVKNQSDWESLLVSGWNTIEWDCSQFDARTSFSDMSSFQLRVFTTYKTESEVNSTQYNAETSNHIVYIDDIVFFNK